MSRSHRSKRFVSRAACAALFAFLAVGGSLATISEADPKGGEEAPAAKPPVEVRPFAPKEVTLPACTAATAGQWAEVDISTGLMAGAVDARWHVASGSATLPGPMKAVPGTGWLTPPTVWSANLGVLAADCPPSTHAFPVRWLQPVSSTNHPYPIFFLKFTNPTGTHTNPTLVLKVSGSPCFYQVLLNGNPIPPAPTGSGGPCQGPTASSTYIITDNPNSGFSPYIPGNGNLLAIQVSDPQKAYAPAILVEGVFRALCKCK